MTLLHALHLHVNFENTWFTHFSPVISSFWSTYAQSVARLQSHLILQTIWFCLVGLNEINTNLLLAFHLPAAHHTHRYLSFVHSVITAHPFYTIICLFYPCRDVKEQAHQVIL